jgi:phage FluMu gp28-like protein
MQILNGSGNSAANQAFLRKLQQALPDREWLAVAAWLSTFYGFQQTWLLDTARFALLVKCRQIGGSHTLAAAAVLWGMLGEDTSIVSIGEREGTEVLKKVSLHLEALRRLGSEWAGIQRQAATRITMASGATIFALPSTSGGRGQSGNMLLDEAAYFERAAEVWDGASATVLHGYRMRVCSTPNGVGNLFHQLIRDHESLGYRLHRVNLDEARADGLSIKDDECWKMARGDPRLFDQLFRCSFLDSELQYIPSALIEECSTDDLQTSDGAYFAGLDIGKTVDRTVLTVIRKSGGLLVTQWIESSKRTDSDALEAMVDRAFKKYDLRRLCLDSTGMGAFPAQRMRKIHGASKVEPVNFTLQVKEDLATALYSSFAEHKIRIPKTRLEGCAPGEPAGLREDIAALRRIITTAGNVRYDAPHTDEGHADRAWSLALALHAGLKAPSYALI